MTGSLTSALVAVRRAAAGVEPERLSADASVALLRELAEVERVLAAVRVRVCRRVAETNAWRSSGERSAAHFVARETGTAVGVAATTLETAARLDDLPTARAAFAAGRLSEAQVAEIASAAASPSQEALLVAVAATDSLAGLRAEAQTIRAANRPDHLAGLRARRSCRTWTDREGFFRLDARLAPDAGARVEAALDAHRQALFAEGRSSDVRDPYDAAMADALERAVTSGTSVSAEVVVRADVAALRRGSVAEGEVCEIPGVGPLPVAAAVDLMGEAFLKLVVCEGTDVRNVVHLGRRASSVQRTALLERDGYACTVVGCRSRGTEIDHVTGWARTRTTELDDLQLLCRWHHRRKTRADAAGPSP